MNLRQRFLELQSVLNAHQALWRPSPFYVRRPEWCAQWPALAEAVLGLDESTLEAFVDDPEACRGWLAARLPVVGLLAPLCALAPLPSRDLPACDGRFDWFVPGRKREQIEAFAAHGPVARAPLLEWCAGKGHLGRRLALSDGQPVSSLEIDPALCADASRLAARVGVGQTVLCADALDETSRRHVRGRAVLALHACGELHRSLVRSAALDGADSYRIAPCCYYRGAQEGYRPLSRAAALSLDGSALRLAVTETVTAPQRIRRRLARDQVWKLAFVALRNAVLGEQIRPFRPVPSIWMAGDFAAYAQALAQREGMALPEEVDWAHWLAVGERRRGEVRRLELVRHAFRRALEVWLVLDVALGLEEAGFEVEVGTFCARALTPRNLMVLARRRDAAAGFLNGGRASVSVPMDALPNEAVGVVQVIDNNMKKENRPMSQESIWTNRYREAGEAYLFGTEPNRFLAHRADALQSGRTALSVADGEGRNSVWLAEQGLEVTAIEISAVAVEKARRLAQGRKVQVSFLQADMLAPGWPPAELHGAFDWVVGIFIQFVGPEWRDRQFDAMKQLTRPGGRILLQGYTVKQLEYRTGGPSAVENLYTDEILRDAFADWEIEELVEYEEDIAEGSGHKGRSALIGLVARKPA